MKFAEITLLILLLFGFCSPRTLEKLEPREVKAVKRRDVDHLKPKSQPLTHLKNTIYQKLWSMYQQLISSGKYSVQLDHLPDLTDPVYVGSAVDHYSLIQVSYDNVQFQGLRDAHHAVLNVNIYAQEVTITLNLEKAEIRGDYASSDLAQNTSGQFHIQMNGNMSYECKYRYQIQGGRNVQLLPSSGQLHYLKAVSFYSSSASYQVSIQKALQTVLMQTIDEKVLQALLAKMKDHIQKSILEVHQNHPPDSIAKGMREGINSTIDEILQVLAKHGVLSIDLTSDEKEMVYNKVQAKIVSVRLNGIEKFYLTNNQVTQEKSNKIHVKVQLAISRLTATTVVSIREAFNEGAPFQNLNVDFDMEQLMVELSIDKPIRQSGLELRSVRTSVSRIRPLGTEKFESQVSNFVKEKLTNHMKPYVEESLKNFIQNEFIVITSQGVLSPTYK